MVCARPTERAFFGAAALLFVASTAGTILWCGSGSRMGAMPMGSGRAMSTVWMPAPWMPMPGESWLGAAASFLGMWIVMMVAMMLPSLVPMLHRYRNAVAGAGEARLGSLTALVGLGYFFVWTVLGMAVFVLGASLSLVATGLPFPAWAAPLAAGLVVLIAGALQFTAWKARHLACCREVPGHGRVLAADASTAWRHGLRLGLHCCYCCGGLMAILLVIGIMDLRAMAAVMAAITLERLAPAGQRIAQASGVVIVVAGLFLIVRAGGVG